MNEEEYKQLLKVKIELGIAESIINEAGEKIKAADASIKELILKQVKA